jgi:hypothetical protein
MVLAIGTPGPELEQTVLGRLRTYATDHPQDQMVVWREHSAAGFEDHPVDCAHCWELANPALDDFLARDGFTACLPPKMREASFRRARLCQLTDQLKEAWRPREHGPRPRTPPGASPMGQTSPPSMARSMGTPPSWSWPPSTSGPTSTWSSCGSRTAARCPWSTSSRRSGRRAGAGGSWRSPPTRSGGRVRSSSSTARAYPSWSTRRPAGQGTPRLATADRRRGGRRHGPRSGRRPGRGDPGQHLHLIFAGRGRPLP